MVTFFIYLGLMTFGAIVAISIAAWAAQRTQRTRNILGLLFAATASYAAGFFVDMLVSTFAGDIPTANVIAPAFTWFAITAVATVAALATQAAPVALGLPFGVNAAVALAATAVRSRHTIVSAVLLLCCVFIVIVRRRLQASHASRLRPAAEP